jgi:alkylation response protein AidB-like acyl-CoA dehydrogenase
MRLVEDLESGLADPRGVPLLGRRDEHERLRAAGARDLAWGRLYEGHVNALQLIARLGDDRQRARAAGDVAAGRLFGVWNTEAHDGVRIAGVGIGGVVLAGRKTFASGAGRVARAVVTAAWPDGGSQLMVVPLDRVTVVIDRSFWRPYGMEASDSFAVDFTMRCSARPATTRARRGSPPAHRVSSPCKRAPSSSSRPILPPFSNGARMLTMRSS